MYTQSMSADINARRLAMDAASERYTYTIACPSHGYVGTAQGHVSAMTMAMDHVGLHYCEPHLQVHNPQA